MFYGAIDLRKDIQKMINGVILTLKLVVEMERFLHLKPRVVICKLSLFLVLGIDSLCDLDYSQEIHMDKSL